MVCPAEVIAAVGQCKESKLYYIADITEVAAPYSRPGGNWQVNWGHCLGGLLSKRLYPSCKDILTGCEERGQRKKAFHSHGVDVGVFGPWEGQPASGL